MSRERELPALATTGIGSLPFRDVDRALAHAFRVDIPYLPQLPMRDAREFMLHQAIEGLPGLSVDTDGLVTVDGEAWAARRADLDRTLDEALGNDRFDMLEPTAAACIAWAPFVKSVEQLRPAFAKVQIAGPITTQWALRIDGAESVAAEVRAQASRLILARAMAMTGRIARTGATPLVFIDEPGLYAFSRSNPRHLLMLQELKILLLAIRRHGGIVGLHCCANTDWKSLFDLGLDVLSLDTRLSMKALLADAEDFVRFTGGGGRIALGAIPTNVGAPPPVDALLSDLLQVAVGSFAARSQVIFGILGKSLLTPACGLALRTPDETERTFADLSALKERLKAKTTQRIPA